jgi:hypothetical protein
MYAIDFTTCSANDVIRRSVVCHPSLYAENMRNVAHVHAQAAMACEHDTVAAKVAGRLAQECRQIAERIEAGDEVICATLSETIPAFNVAARLNCISHAVAKDIINRE